MRFIKFCVAAETQHFFLWHFVSKDISHSNERNGLEIVGLYNAVKIYQIRGRPIKFTDCGDFFRLDGADQIISDFLSDL